jgi:hypothetical protein
MTRPVRQRPTRSVERPAETSHQTGACVFVSSAVQLAGRDYRKLLRKCAAAASSPGDHTHTRARDAAPASTPHVRIPGRPFPGRPGGKGPAAGRRTWRGRRADDGRGTDDGEPATGAPSQAASAGYSPLDLIAYPLYLLQVLRFIRSPDWTAALGSQRTYLSSSLCHCFVWCGEVVRSRLPFLIGLSCYQALVFPKHQSGYLV